MGLPEKIDNLSFKEKLINEITNSKIEEILNKKQVFFKVEDLALSLSSVSFIPTTSELYIEERGHFLDRFKNSLGKNNFYVDKDSFNRIVNTESNNGNDYGYMFFSKDIELTLVLVFSKKIVQGDFDLLKDQTFYLLASDGTLSSINNQVFLEKTKTFNSDFSNILIASGGSDNYTQHIRFDINDVKRFQGFEHNFTFDMVYEEASRKINIALIIVDNNTSRLFGFYNKGVLWP